MMDRLRRRKGTLPTGTAARDDDGTRKRRSLSVVAGNLQNVLRASFGRGRRRTIAEGSSQRLESECTTLFNLFLHLPTELHILILTTLPLSTILSLRLTCRNFHALVSTCSSALVRHWVKHRFGPLHTSLYPAPPPSQAEFRYLLEMRRRHIASIRLSRRLADFVMRDTLRDRSGRQRKMWSSVYERMVPLVFAVEYFLEEHRRIILSRDLRDATRKRTGFSIESGPAIIEEEKEIMKRFNCPLRLQYFFMYCFIIQTLQRKLRPPTYVGAVERRMRGWTAEPASEEDIAFVVVLGGISQVAKLLACKTYNERRKVLDAFIAGLLPTQNASWKRKWEDLGVYQSHRLDALPSTSIRITRIDLVWEPLMAKMMEDRSPAFTSDEKTKYEEMKSSRKFINGVMGYDILRGRSADGDDSEVEGDGAG